MMQVAQGEAACARQAVASGHIRPCLVGDTLSGDVAAAAAHH